MRLIIVKYILGLIVFLLGFCVNLSAMNNRSNVDVHIYSCSWCHRVIDAPSMIVLQTDHGLTFFHRECYELHHESESHCCNSCFRCLWGCATIIGCFAALRPLVIEFNRHGCLSGDALNGEQNFLACVRRWAEDLFR